MVAPVNGEALELVRGHCDIEARLAAIPPSARQRGLTFGALRDAVRRAGAEQRYDELFDRPRFQALKTYPLAEYMLHLAVIGALVRSPSEVLEGIREANRNFARAYADTLLGRTVIRLLSNNPVKLSEQGLAMRRNTSLYGHWELVHHGPREIEMIYRDEYMWIEHAVAGAAQGTFEACGMTPTLETRLIDRYNGSTLIRW